MIVTNQDSRDATRDTRLEARVSAAQKSLLQQAAALDRYPRQQAQESRPDPRSPALMVRGGPVGRLPRKAAATRFVSREGRPTFVAPSAAFVVDASVSAAWFLPDQATAYTRAALHATATSVVWVPVPWLPEMANLLCRTQRRRRITAAKRAELAAAAAAQRLQACREPVSLPTPDALAADHALSAQDACYPELALRRGLPLATLDQDLSAAMLRSGVPAAALHT
jgi:predicted nucleic acid-binding protein